MMAVLIPLNHPWPRPRIRRAGLGALGNPLWEGLPGAALNHVQSVARPLDVTDVVSGRLLFDGRVIAAGEVAYIAGLGGGSSGAGSEAVRPSVRVRRPRGRPR